MTDAANEPVVAEASPAARVALRRLRHRRSKLIKSLLMITVVSALMVVISVNERDRQQGKRCRRSLARYAQMIQQSLPGPIPAELFELRDEPEVLVPEHYAYLPGNVLGSVARRVDIAVCYCAAPHRLLSGANGRNVLVISGGRFGVEWMTEEVFQARRTALGIPPEPAPKTDAP